MEKTEEWLCTEGEQTVQDISRNYRGEHVSRVEKGRTRERKEGRKGDVLLLKPNFQSS
jgi:hypothetical protein